MSWHYEKNGKVMGPVDDAQLESARALGEITPASRVWREGWPDWRRASEVWPDPAAGAKPPPPLPAPFSSATVCCECGREFPPGELMTLEGSLVCAACKPLAVQKLQENVSLGSGPWRQGKIVVVQKNVPLPQRCIKCGATPAKQLRKVLYWHHPAVYLAILPGILIYVILALVLRKTIILVLPLCRECNGRRKRNMLIGWLAFLGAIGLFVMAGAATRESEVAFLLGGLGLLLFSLIWAICVRFVLPKKITETHAWVAKFGRPFIESLPVWPKT